MTFLQLRLDTPTGEVRGKIILYTSDRKEPYQIPVLIRRQILDGQFAVPVIDFGSTSSERPVADTTVIFKNSGELPLTLTRMNISPPFALLSPLLPVTLEPNQEITLQLRFAPQTAGDVLDTMTMVTAPCNISPILQLSGRRADKPAIEIATSEIPHLLCPEESPGESRVIVRNRGGEPLVIDSTTLSGIAGEDYVLLNSPSVQTILPGDSLVLQLQFIPKGTGNREALLTLHHNVDPGFSEIELLGIKDSVNIETSLNALSFGNVLICDTSLGQEITLYNNGTLLFLLKASASEQSLSLQTGSSSTILANDSLSLQIRFQPTQSGTFVDTLSLSASPCDLEHHIPIQVRVLEPSLKIETDTLHFGLLTNCDNSHD